ncbi:Apple-like protein [Cynara cardunculus var. scolymus]|uniref:non-specific serine/threonine protein kinase n=1 Tax=Cynara cardunculus var. scolymus TaxID=59895 RepID=A0A103Y467_CYNCS|nr:Apple-like protein [Cynara cardunculus var. scolymus]
MTTTTMAEQERNITSFHLSILVLYALITCTTAADTIAADQTIKGNETILSPQQTFELGFFSPENSTNRYVGIWYKKISPGTVMWVANRNSPLSNNSGELSLTLQGILVLRNSTGDVIWSSANSSSSLPSVRNPVAQLLDTGNFIIREENGSPENPIWQSFDFPSDTFVPGMKFGKDLVTGLERYFTSWKSENDPSIGDHSVWIETKGYPQLIVRDGRKIRFRAGPWNGLRFSGEPNLRPNSIYRFGFVLDQREMYYHFDLINSSVVTRVVLKPSGSLERLLWIENRREWLLYLTPQTDSCDRYGLCGPFGSCDINNSLSCECLEGFEPASPDQWNVADWTQGCRRSTPLDCGSGDGFRKYSNLKLPDTQESWFNQSMNLDECKMVCEKNCNCSAYTTQNITGSGSGCLLWFGTLKGAYGDDPGDENSKDDLELPLIDFSILRKATNNFSDNNKLGEGGFGPVYKGVLGNGQEVAVKRLSKTSTQGLDEFKNEVICISKLQHRNLVKLLGCCIKGAEKMLVYEYMPNKGLDSFIFASLDESISLSEAIRLIHVSLLCVQQRPEDRPTMSSVILMLESDGKLPPPKLPASTAINTIAVNQTIRDGDTIVSADETFRLGFFSPGRSANRYVGIWYKKISEFTVVWVANREAPLANRSGVLTLDPSGTLVVRNTTSAIIWSSNSSRPATNPMARLLDSGNLVIGDNNPENPIWQIEVNAEGYPQGMQWQGEAIQFRLGPWDGLKWSGMPNLKENPIFGFEFVLNQSDIYYKYELKSSSIISRMTLAADGNFNRMNWINRAQGWYFYSSTAPDNCARYRLCGAYGSCNINNIPLCECIDGFEPRKPEEWSMADWSSGCERRNPLNCKSGDGFRKYSNLKFPDSRGSWFNQTMNLQECETVCLNNCSCTAYSNSDIRGGGRGCILWFGDLIDIIAFDHNGDDLYIRMASLDIRYLEQVYENENQNEELELPSFNLSTFLEATNNFSVDFKLGEGGFGPVYKYKFARGTIRFPKTNCDSPAQQLQGRLITGQEIAVKRLSKNSGQGLEEFKNEIHLISKLQHRNLVRVLGYCLEGDERMLAYEYLPNRSLDYFIFGKALQLADSVLEESFVESQMLKFIQVALLCTQKFPKDRPTMSSVVLMLCNDGVTLPPPKQPGFFLEGDFMETDMSFGEENYFSRNLVTITAVEAELPATIASFAGHLHSYYRSPSPVAIAIAGHLHSFAGRHQILIQKGAVFSETRYEERTKW